MTSMLVDWMCHAPEEELYAAEKDIYELHNLAVDPGNAAVLADMRKRLYRWMAKQGVREMVAQFEARFPEVKAGGPLQGALAPEHGKLETEKVNETKGSRQ
jgi:hypothetical protein